jgi:hypothetical protein
MAIGTSGLSVPSLGQSIDPSIYGNKEAPKGMSLSDIVDLSRSSTALQKEKALLQPGIEAGQAASKQAVAQADTAQLENNIKHVNNVIQSQQRLLTKPDLTADDVIKSVKEHAKNAGTSDQQVNQALQGLPVGGSAADLRSWLAMSLSKTLSAQSQLEKVYPQGVLPGQLPSSYQPETQEQPKTTIQEPHNQPEKLSYPVPKVGQPRAQLPSEIKDTAEGQTYRSSLVNRQSSLTTDRRNIDEVIKTANELEKSYMPTSGIAGSAYRHLATWMGDPTYKQLGKDLANVQMANIKAQGGSLDTVAGQQLSKMANGDETYPPSVLMSIAARAKADMTNIDAQAIAAQKFSQKFGDNNMKAFQQMWSKNADSKIFEVMNLAKDTNLDAKEKKKIVDHLLGDDPKERAIFNEKYQNILKLQQNGTL